MSLFHPLVLQDLPLWNVPSFSWPSLSCFVSSPVHYRNDLYKFELICTELSN